MTEVFGICGIGWKYKVTNRHFTEKDSFGQVAVFIDIDLFIKIGDTWSDAIPGCGGSTFIANEKNGLYMSDEAVKMATTDALSVAMKMLGVGADVYMGHGGKYDKPIENTPLPKLEKTNPKWQQVKDFCQSKGKAENWGFANVEKKFYLTSEIKEALKNDKD